MLSLVIVNNAIAAILCVLFQLLHRLVFWSGLCVVYQNLECPSSGQFGEGAKVEINRLIQEGCTVRYWTGNAAWTFGRTTAQGCIIPELHVTVQPGPDLFDFVGIAVAANSSYSDQLLDVSKFLFLQASYEKIASMPIPTWRWSGMELLLEPRHHAKVFIQGVSVADAPSYKGFGINYTGK